MLGSGARVGLATVGRGGGLLHRWGTKGATDGERVDDHAERAHQHIRV
jgi:hypothetical protein